MARRESSFDLSVPTITRGKTAVETWWSANIVANWDIGSMSVSQSMDNQFDNIMGNKASDRVISEITRMGTTTVVGS